MKRLRILAGFLCMLLAGCHAKVLTPTPGDSLRQQVQDLEARNAALQSQTEELEAQLARKNSSTPGSPSAELEQATPRVAKISIGSLSRALAKKEAPGKPAGSGMLIVFLNVEDGKGRPIQLTGELTLVASLQTVDGKLIPLASAHWGPLQLRDQYRGGFGSPHYLLQEPLEGAMDMANATALVVATYVDGWTGRTLKTERAIPWPIDDFAGENPPKSE